CAEVDHARIPILPCTQHYLDLGTSPGGTSRNWQSYGDKVDCPADFDFRVIADPQTSGGLLVSIAAEAKDDFETFMADRGMTLQAFGTLKEKAGLALSLR
ncbi:MAG: selenide, water dikinase SelD, partial [Cyclobacteriaceae bacterium]